MTPSRYARPPAYLVCALVAVLIAVLYVRHEHPAYVWDWGGYWHTYQRYGDVFTKDFIKFILQVKESVAVEDYNSFGIVPFMPIYSLLGGGRTTYIAAICALYVVPTAFVAVRLAFEAHDERPGKAFAALAAAVLFPVFWNAALRGMVDVAGLIPLGLAAATIWNTRFLTRASWKTAVLLGLLLWVTFLLRRWYALSIVCLVGLSVPSATIIMITRRRSGPTEALRMLGLYAITGMTFVVGLLSFQWPLVQRILTTNYGEIYSAYQKTPWSQFGMYYAEFGAFTLAVTALGLVVDITRRQYKSSFFITVALLTGCVFARVQAPGVHHFLPIALMIFPAYCSGVIFVYDKLPSILRILVPLLLMLNFVNGFVATKLGAIEPLRDLFQVSRHHPLRLDNYFEYRRLVGDLKALDADARIAIFASSAFLSDSLLVALDGSLNRRMIFAAHVDLRDRFRWETLTADYFVIGVPTPLHLNPAGQRVISFPAEEIANHTGIGTSLQDTGRSYRLDRGIVAKLYKRVRTIQPADVAHLAERFYRFYPDWQEADRRNVRLMLASASISRGDVWGQVLPIDNARLFIHPGDTLPTKLSYPLGGLFDARTLTVSIGAEVLKPCPNADGVAIDFGTATGSVSSVVTPGSSASFNIPDAPGTIEVSVSPRANSYCDHVIFSFGF